MADANAKYFNVNLIFIHVSTPIGVQEKESVPRVQFGITRQSLVMPNCNSRGRFLDQYLSLMKNSYILSLSKQQKCKSACTFTVLSAFITLHTNIFGKLSNTTSDQPLFFFSRLMAALTSTLMQMTSSLVAVVTPHGVI